MKLCGFCWVWYLKRTKRLWCWRSLEDRQWFRNIFQLRRRQITQRNLPLLTSKAWKITSPIVYWYRALDSFHSRPIIYDQHLLKCQFYFRFSTFGAVRRQLTARWCNICLLQSEIFINLPSLAEQNWNWNWHLKRCFSLRRMVFQYKHLTDYFDSRSQFLYPSKYYHISCSFPPFGKEI
jgi:hypothetical protein